VVSGEPVLEALFDAGALGGEGDRVAAMGDQRVDIGLRGGDPLRVVVQLRSAR
jgi:hypothetical protein